MPIEYQPYFILIWLAVFSVLYLSIMLLTAYVGGWRRLAGRFPANTQPPWPGDVFRFQTVRIGWFGRYSGCINVTVGNCGIYLKPIVLYAPGHPPIALSWEILAGASFGRSFFMEYLECDIEGTTLWIGGKSAAVIRERIARRRGCR